MPPTDLPNRLPPPAPGHPGNLTPAQLALLRGMWRQWHAWLARGAAPAESAPPTPSPAPASTPEPAQAEPTASQQLLDAYSPSQIEHGLWDMAKMEDPDGLFCRFLRARKWDLAAALDMFAAALKWRLDSDLEALIRRNDSGSPNTTLDLVEQGASGKAFAYGATATEQPVTYVHVKKHLANAQPEDTMQKCIQYAVETCRLLMMPPADKVSLVFNVEGFGLKNVDWQMITYVLSMLEKYYPESLGTLYVLNAPWLFNGFWKGLAPMLDPVVRAKIQFIKNASEAAEVIPRDRFLGSLPGGEAQHTYDFPYPQPKDNAKLADTETYDALRAKRDDAWRAFSAATQEWCTLASSASPDQAEVKAVMDRRRLCAKKIRVAHLDLEPYYRPTTVFDRCGQIDRRGRVIWFYPQKSGRVFRHVCGRVAATPTLRRELDEVENQGLSIDDAEARTRKAIKDQDWIALYGSAEAAVEIEGADYVRLPRERSAPPALQHAHTNSNATSSSSSALTDPPPQLTLNAERSIPLLAPSQASRPTATTAAPTPIRPKASRGPHHIRRDSTSSIRSSDSFASALSEMPEGQDHGVRRLPGHAYRQIGGPMALEIGQEHATPPPGSPGNLSQEQEACLRDMWEAYFACKRYAESCSRSPTPTNLDDPEERPELTEEVQLALDALVAAHGPAAMGHIWEFIKMDNPDSLILRFLRARKWVVPDALVMAIDCIKWRLDYDVEALVRGGDLGNAEVYDKFLDQERAAKTYARGTTSATQQPICYIHVAKHVTSAQPPETMEKFVVYAMETFRLLMSPPQENATLFFDLTGFGLKNMDWNTIGFIIKCCESFYPECLGKLFVHNAPWLFQAIWTALAPMLDPVVRSKIVFSSSAKDCADIVPPGRLIAALGGNVDNGFQFLEPVPGENDMLQDTEARDRAKARYIRLTEEFEEMTRLWIASDGQNATIRHKRAILTKQLRVAQFDLEPYVRGQTVYHRNGTLDGQGKVTWLYRQKDGHLIRHVVGRISCVGTLEREILEMQAGASLEEVERKSSAALKAADWLTLYGDPAVANHLEGTSFAVEGVVPTPAAESTEEDTVAAAAAAAAAAATGAVSPTPPPPGVGPARMNSAQTAGLESGEASWADMATGLASDLTEKITNLHDFALGAPSTLQDFLAAPYQRTPTPSSPAQARRSTSSRRSSRRLSSQVFTSLSGWDGTQRAANGSPTSTRGHQRGPWSASVASDWTTGLYERVIGSNPSSPSPLANGAGSSSTGPPPSPLTSAHSDMRWEPRGPVPRFTARAMTASPVGAGLGLKMPVSSDHIPSAQGVPRLLSPPRPQSARPGTSATSSHAVPRTPSPRAP